jgi:hypothetical protein
LQLRVRSILIIVARNDQPILHTLKIVRREAGTKNHVREHLPRAIEIPPGRSHCQY